MPTSHIVTWLRQPTTIHGIAGLVGTGAAVIAGVLTHNIDVALGAGTILASVVAIAIPDNTTAQGDAARFGTDMMQAVMAKKLETLMPTLAVDALTLIESATSRPPASAAATVPVVAVPKPT